MKRRLTEKERSIKQIIKDLDYFDQLVNDGVLSRNELTKIILHRHILSMKHTIKYAEKNLNCKVIFSV